MLSSEVDRRRQALVLIYDQRFCRLRDFVLEELDFSIKHEYDLCIWTTQFINLKLLSAIEQRECFCLCESLKFKYLTMKISFADIDEESFEITELMIKSIDKLNFILEKKHEFNLSAINRFKHLIYDEGKTYLLHYLKLFIKISKNAYRKTMGFKNIPRYIRASS